MKLPTYSTRVTMEDLADHRSRDGTDAFLRRVVADLWRRSGGLNVPKTARMIGIEDPASRTLRFRVYFNSTAWTGR